MIEHIRSSLLDTARKGFLMGVILLGPILIPFILWWRELARGALLVLGRSGSGKSKLLELLVRRCIASFQPVVVVDAEGDLTEDIAAYCVRRMTDTGSEALLQRLHYLRPSWDSVFGFDIFDCEHVPDDPTARRAWLHTRAQRMVSIIILAQGESDTLGKPRLERVLFDVIVAVGTPIDADGKHRLPFADVFVLLDVFHTRHDEVYALVRPHLPPEIRRDIEVFQSLRNRPHEIEKYVESSVNRLRSFLGGLVQAIFSKVDASFDIAAAIRNRGIILINLKDTDYFSPEQANALGRMFVFAVLTAVRSVNRSARVPVAFIIDECQRFVSDHYEVLMRQSRKWGIAPLVLASQNIEGFKIPEKGYTPTMLSEPNTIVCFETRLPDHLDVLGPLLEYPNLDFTELLTVVDRPDGYDWVDVREASETWSDDIQWNQAENEAWMQAIASSQAFAASQEQGGSIAENRNWSHADSETEGDTTTQGTATARTTTDVSNTGESPIIEDGHVREMVPLYGNASGEGSSESDIRSNAHNTSHVTRIHLPVEKRSPTTAVPAIPSRLPLPRRRAVPVGAVARGAAADHVVGAIPISESRSPDIARNGIPQAGFAGPSRISFTAASTS